MITLNWFSIVLIIGISQGIFLLLLLCLKHLKLHKANKFLVALIGTIVLSLILRIFYSQNLYDKYPHLSELGDFVMFVFGPFLYFYINSLLYENFKLNFRHLIHFIPFLVFLMAFSYLATIEGKELIKMSSSGALNPYYNIMLSTAIIQNATYLFIALYEIKVYKKDFYQKYSETDKVQYLRVIIEVMLFSISLWATGFSISIIYTQGFSLSNLSYQLGFIALASLAFIIGVYAVNQPQIFKVKIQEKKIKYQDSLLNENEILNIKFELEKIFREEKLYLDPKLSLVKLAKSIDVNQVNLSRVINESYNKNFYDVVNEYRVKEFITKVLSNEYKNFTYLGIALESGFNTKTTFNKAFKKITNVTPREFFKNSDQMMKELNF